MSIVNYLKNSKKVTAPRNWKSAPDSPETQLAYVTQPEIDMLVKANLHDSMDGKPNRGPNGIISLDGGGSSKKIKTKRPSGSKTKDAVRASRFDQPKKQKKQKQSEKKQKKTIKQTIMGGGKGGDPTITKKEWAKTAPKGEHKLATQYNRLVAKYGEGWKDTVQAKQLEGYLSGVPVEKGGSLGSYSPQRGTADAGINANDPGEVFRKDLLEGIASGKYTFDHKDITDPDVINWMRGRDINDSFHYSEKKPQELTPAEYFRFRQQLMAADPTLGNMAYKEKFPISSGYGVENLIKSAVSPLATLGKGIMEGVTGKKMEKKIPQEPFGSTSDRLFSPLPIPPEKSRNEGIGSYLNESSNYDPRNDPSIRHALLGWGPMDRMQYTAVQPREGYQYAYDQQGRRYEIPIGDTTSGTTYGGDPYSFREEGEIWKPGLGTKELLDLASAPTMSPTTTMNAPYYYGSGDYGLAHLFDSNQNFVRLAGGGIVPGYADGGMIPGYAGGGLMGIDTSKPNYSDFGNFILTNLPQGGIGNAARRVV